jgi:hypothetical protein
MIIGMLPMAIEPGQNAPLGSAVIGGLYRACPIAYRQSGRQAMAGRFYDGTFSHSL